MSELDPGSDWSVDPGTGLYKTDNTLTQRTKKVQRPITLYEATKEHPAQTQLITEDVIVAGFYFFDNVRVVLADHAVEQDGFRQFQFVEQYRAQLR